MDRLLPLANNCFGLCNPCPSVKPLPRTSDACPFSFLSQCKPDAQALLEKEVPGDGIIGVDGDSGRLRGLIHQQITLLIREFLVQSSGYKTVGPSAAPARQA
ncbi:hypothetical protein [Pseudomonas sp. AL 58]|uniref:hypothetical protein n=1 Tax=Pseudomonas sp. AL 58 TaxID=3104275 RepID=UPI003FA6A897